MYIVCSAYVFPVYSSLVSKRLFKLWINFYISIYPKTGQILNTQDSIFMHIQMVQKWKSGYLIRLYKNLQLHTSSKIRRGKVFGHLKLYSHDIWIPIIYICRLRWWSTSTKKQKFELRKTTKMNIILSLNPLYFPFHPSSPFSPRSKFKGIAKAAEWLYLVVGSFFCFSLFM